MKKITLLLLFISQFSFAQKIDLNKDLPMDPSVKIGKLKNGLTYYIKRNIEPAKRAQLRLVLKAGSILETDSQRGLAHFMEHMNFNGTKNFPKNELVNFLEKSGIQFGADLNAYTSFDETVYMLPVPSDTLSKLEKYLGVLADWAVYATLDHAEIDKERGVVLEESRLRKGAQSRIQAKLLPMIFNGSKYADRLPIGLDTIIKSAPYSEVEKFHKTWYRPDLEAVIAVGDFDVAVMEAMIIKQFGKIPAAIKPIPRPKSSVPLKGGSKALVITDNEQPYNLVQVYYFKPEKKEVKAADRRNAIVTSLFNTMINNRLQELTKVAKPPFQFGASNYSPFLADLDALQLFAVAKGADIETALKAVLDENERALKFGFTGTELDRAKLGYKTQLEKQLKEKDKTDSENYVEELVGSFLNGVPMTDIQFDNTFSSQNLDGIKLEEINALVKSIISKENRVVTVVASEKDKDKLPTEAQLLKWLDNTGNEIKAYVDEKIASSLVDKVPNPGKIKSEKVIAEVGVTEITFENGVRISLKPTDFKNDEIKFSATSWGGTSLYEDAEIENASMASMIANTSGNGKLTSNQLNKYMSGKVARVNASVGSYSENINGSSSVKDLETALQMVYNRFTNNNLDLEASKGAINNQKDMLANFEKTPTPEKAFNDSIQAIMGNYAYRSMPMSTKRIEKVNIEKSFAMFKDRFKDAADFSFYMIGNFEVEKIKPLLATYLGSLPSGGLKENYKDLKIVPPSGQIKKVVKRGTEDKASVALVFSGVYAPSNEEETQIEALGDILNIKLTEKLREEEGNVYSPYVYGFGGRTPSPRFMYRIGYGCKPSNVDKLVGITLKEIEKIAAEGATQVDIDKFMAKQKLDLETNLKNNDYWLGMISKKYQRNEELKTILDDGKLYTKVTIESTKNAAKKYLNQANMIQVVLLPEK